MSAKPFPPPELKYPFTDSRGRRLRLLGRSHKAGHVAVEYANAKDAGFVVEVDGDMTSYLKLVDIEGDPTLVSNVFERLPVHDPSVDLLDEAIAELIDLRHKTADALAAISKLERSIRDHVSACGQAYEHWSGARITYVPANVTQSWDKKMLEGMVAVIPEIEKARTQKVKNPMARIVLPKS